MVVCGRIFRVIIILSEDCEVGIALDAVVLKRFQIELISNRKKERSKKSHAISRLFYPCLSSKYTRAYSKSMDTGSSRYERMMTENIGQSTKQAQRQ